MHDDQSEDMVIVVGSWWGKHPWDLLWPEDEKRDLGSCEVAIVEAGRRQLRSEIVRRRHGPALRRPRSVDEDFSRRRETHLWLRIDIMSSWGRKQPLKLLRPWVLGRDCHEKVLCIGHYEEVRKREEDKRIMVPIEAFAGAAPDRHREEASRKRIKGTRITMRMERTSRFVGSRRGRERGSGSR